MGTNFRGCLIFAFFAVRFEIREIFILNKIYIINVVPFDHAHK